ncbi:MAG: sensor histidine kinase, partial [Rhizobiaceae bacterium]
MIVGDQHAHRLARRKAHGRAPRAHALLAGFAALLLALVMLVPTPPANAAEPAPLVLNGPVGIDVISQHLEYTADSDWQMNAEDFVGPAGVAMRTLPGPRPDFGYTTAKIWLRIKLTNATAANDDWRVYMPVSFLQQLAMYRIGADGTLTTLLDLKEDSPFSARPVDNPQIVVPFALASGETATLLIAYQSMGASRHPFSIETPASLGQQTRIVTAKSYAFYGAMLLMIALALVALATVRQPVFAAYAIYLGFIFLYIAHADGMAFQYLWPNAPQLNTMAASFAGSGFMVFGAIFAMVFLETRRYHPVMHRLLIAVVALVLVLDVALWTTAPALLNRILVYMILLCVLIFFTAGVVAARTRFREVRFYLLSYAAALIPASLFTASFALGIEQSVVTPYDAIRVGLLFESLMMGLAIFDRYNQLRQAAAEETLAHAQRNLALSQRLSALEGSYELVRANAHQREESVKDTVHDLRQPMHALRLSLRQMLDPQTAKAGDFGQVESALAYMERLVADRLADSNSPVAAANAPAPETGPGIHAVLQGVAEMFSAEASEKGLGLKLVLAAPDGAVAAYPLMRVLSNLVSNAIKYTRHGRVLVDLRSRGSGWLIEVHDTGPGLSGAAFELALIRNRRLDRDLDAAEGSGLGLSVVKETAAANGWRLSACDGRRNGATV